MIQVKREHEGSVVRILLDQPKGNILTKAMMEAITASVKEEGNKSSLRLFVLEGSGDHFSFGASVEEHKAEQIEGVLKTFGELFRTLSDTNVPVASLIRGQCLGGGFELALFSHFMFAGEKANLGVPEITLGVFPPPAALLLPLKVGNALADRMILSGRIYKAGLLERLGLLDAVWPEEEVEEHFQAWLKKSILPLSPSSLRYATRASRFFFNQKFLSSLEKLNQMYCQELMKTQDANEGIHAFIEKRKPQWRNP